MAGEALLCQFLIFSAWLAIVCVWPYADAATRSEYACNLYILGLHKFYEVFHDDVDAVFVEIAMVPETEKV